MLSIGFIVFFIICYCFVRICVYVAQIFIIYIGTSPVFRFFRSSRNLSWICKTSLRRTDFFPEKAAAARRRSRPRPAFLPHGTCPAPEKGREPSVFPKTPSLFSFLLSGAGPALIHPPAYLAIRTLLPISSSSFFPGSSTMPPNGICAMSFQSSGTSNSFRTASLITGL